MNMEKTGNTTENTTIRFWPIFIAATLIPIMGAIEVLLDETVAGNLFDDVVFGAINLNEPYMTLVYFISYLIYVGGASLIVRAHGEHDEAKMSHIFSHCISICLITGIAFFVIYFGFRDFWIGLVAGGTEAYEYSRQAFFWQCFFAMVEPMLVFLQTYVLYRGGTFLAGMISFVGILSNLGMSVFFGKRMGIAGITFATMLSAILQILIASAFLFTKKHRLKYRFTVDLKLAKYICALGFGEASVFLAMALMESVVNYVAVHKYGSAGIAAIAIVINLFELVMYVSEGITQYETVAINEYIGQKNPSKISHSVSVTIRAAIIEGLVFSVLYFIFASAFPEAFSIDDPSTAELSIRLVRIISIAPIAVCFIRIMAIFYQYTRRIPRTVFLFLVGWGVMPALLGWAFGQITIEGLIWGMLAGTVLTLAAVYMYVRFVKKEKIFDSKISDDVSQ